jgi:hypothetical protein
VTIGYLDAWADWFSVGQVPGDLWMGPLTIRWWGRVGKIAAFIGGATVVLDLIGPDRLRGLGRRNAEIVQESEDYFRSVRQRYPKHRVLTIFVIGCAIYLAGIFIASVLTPGFGNPLAFAPGLMVAAIGMTAVFRIGPRVLVWILDRREPAIALRYTAISLLVVGFHFDLLAS